MTTETDAEVTFTPGSRLYRSRVTPWRCELEQLVIGPEEDVERLGLYVRVVASNGLEVGLASCGDTYGEGLAHGRLWAAAPDLLEALKEAATTFRAYEGLHLAKDTDEGRAKAATNADLATMCEHAIAKAEAHHV